MKYLRQLSIFNPNEYQTATIAVVGCGAIGSFTALSLAKMGIKNLILYDFDSVETHNLPNQFYRCKDIGNKKVDTIKRIIKSFCGEDISILSNNKYKGGPIFSDITVSATDNMKSRKNVFKNIDKDINQYLIDARMGGQVFVVYTVDLHKKDHIAKYKKTLHNDKQSSKEKCTDQAIIYNVLGVSSVICNQIRKIILKKRFDNMICYDYENNRLINKEW